MTNNYNIDLFTDDTIIAEMGERVRQVRLGKNMTQGELAEESGIAKRTLERFEKGDSIQLTNLVRILRTLGYVDELINLVPEPADSPVALLLKEKNTRYRASGSRKKKDAAEEHHQPWVWGE
ncbi:MAG: helix-turn-helix domain-containing protein [Akkermansiaceae bacterium]